MEVACGCLTTGPMSTYSTTHAAKLEFFFTCKLWCHCELHSKISLPGIQINVCRKKKKVMFGLLHSSADIFRTVTVELLCNCN